MNASSQHDKDETSWKDIEKTYFNQYVLTREWDA
jgi:hypothetical protein